MEITLNSHIRQWHHPMVGQLISEASDITPGFVITNMAYHYISNIKKFVETYKFFPHAVTTKNGVYEFPW